MANIYFNPKKNSLLDPEKDCCNLEEWKTNSGEYSCYKHPDGFLVFLDYNEIDISDEYAESDPYKVKENYNSEFQKRRINTTIELLQLIEDKESILDLGCGQGHITQVIKETFPDSILYGLDYALSAIKYAHEHFGTINFAVGNAYSPPYADNSFNVVIINNLWEHVPDPVIMLKSIQRILKPGGYVIISTPSRYRFSNIINILRGRNIKFMSQLHVTEYSVGQVIEQLNYLNFEVKAVKSPPIKERRFISRILKSFLRLILKLLKSSHILESTAFYSAKKSDLA